MNPGAGSSLLRSTVLQLPVHRVVAVRFMGQPRHIPPAVPGFSFVCGNGDMSRAVVVSCREPDTRA